LKINQFVTLSLEMADQVCLGYLNDLSDDDWMRRPHPGCNHLNWQVGHLITSEHQMMQGISAMPPLPSNFADRYTKQTATSDRKQDFCTKSELLRAQKEQRAGTLAIVHRLVDADLDKPTGIDYAPSVGALLNLVPAHWLMHAGQWVVVRRELGHAPLF
jgi:uncharacterized damage-inducible protein DinB